MDDEKIIQMFFNRDENAIKELDLKYRGICHRVSYNILRSADDADECINDAYLGMWNTVPPKHPDPLLTYLCRIVRNLSVTRYHMKTAIKRNSIFDVALEELEGCLSMPYTVESELESKQLTRIIEDFLETLTCENRVIFMRRYYFSDSYEEISKRVGLTKKNISVRLTRVRKQLRDYLREREVVV